MSSAGSSRVRACHERVLCPLDHSRRAPWRQPAVTRHQDARFAMNKPFENNPAACRALAHEHLSRREPILAEPFFARLLGMQPDDLESLQFLANRHFSQGEHARAVELLQRAVRIRPNDPGILRQLGSAQLAMGDFSGATASLRDCLRHAPELFVARLKLGIALEQLGHARDALAAYFMAIRTAQMQGRWLSDANTAADLRDVVKYAMGYVNRGRHKLFSGLLEPLRQRYGSSELVRVEHSLAIYFGEQPANIPDPRQLPKFLYFADVPSQPYYPRERFPWLDALEDATATVRAELDAVLSHQQELEAFLGPQSPGDAQEMLRSSGSQQAAWDAHFFYRHGTRYDVKHTQAAIILIASLFWMPRIFFWIQGTVNNVLPITCTCPTPIVASPRFAAPVWYCCSGFNAQPDSSSTAVTATINSAGAAYDAVPAAPGLAG